MEGRVIPTAEGLGADYYNPPDTPPSEWMENNRQWNGPELTANALRDWCRFTGAGTSYIDPGSPWQNPWVESYGGRMRDELLAVEQFDSLLEVRVLAADWRIEYNTYRPHSALGMLTPVEFAERWRINQPQLS